MCCHRPQYNRCVLIVNLKCFSGDLLFADTSLVSQTARVFMITNNVAHWRTTMNAGKGVSQAHLARKVGVSRSFVTKLEKGKSQPGAELMLLVAAYCKQPVEAIFKLASGTDAMPVLTSSDSIPSRQIYGLTPPARPAGMETRKDKAPVGPAAKVVASLSRGKPNGIK